MSQKQPGNRYRSESLSVLFCSCYFSPNYCPLFLCSDRKWIQRSQPTSEHHLEHTAKNKTINVFLSFFFLPMSLMTWIISFHRIRYQDLATATASFPLSLSSPTLYTHSLPPVSAGSSLPQIITPSCSFYPSALKKSIVFVYSYFISVKYGSSIYPCCCCEATWYVFRYRHCPCSRPRGE